METTDTEPKYPEIEVQLVGADGNGFAIATRVRMALQRAGVPEEECKAFFDEALSGSYEELIATAGRWVSVY